MNKELSVIILSCDKNYDIKNWISKTYNSFSSLGLECLIITETLPINIKNEHVLLDGKNDFSHRLLQGINCVKSKYVLLLLDDYYVHDQYLKAKIIDWMSFINSNDVDALRISKLTKHFIKKNRVKKQYYQLTKLQPYQIDFHPTIWNIKSLKELINDDSLSAWDIEPLFTKDPHKKMFFTKNILIYDELIIGGCFFRKPYRKYCKEYIGARKLITRKKYVKFKTVKFFRDWVPRPIINFFIKKFKIKSRSNL